MQNSNNRGIYHLARTTGGFPACRNKRAYQSVTLEVIKTLHETDVCKKCLPIADKWIARRLGEAE